MCIFNKVIESVQSEERFQTPFCITLSDLLPSLISVEGVIVQSLGLSGFSSPHPFFKMRKDAHESCLSKNN